ncbi:MAG: hypothetical protein IPN53_21595 [Comamonadaceae bacterium]|nr:hypothetical protein [Comamonadaceae bacterium]
MAAQDRCDWGKKYPVIRISFGRGVLRERVELDQRIGETQAHLHRSQRAVVLIDEYDKLILDSIDNSLVAIEICEG